MLEHHAYVLEGDTTLAESLAQGARRALGLPDDSPDVFVLSREKFGIDDSRELRGRAALRATSGRALFVVAASSITSEAQQALLKLFEEPQRGAVFVLIVPHGVLLPTLRSRCLPYPAELSAALAGEGDARERAHAFLAAAYKERTALIAALVKDDGEDVRARSRAFLNALELELHRRFSKANGAGKHSLAEGLSEIAALRSYLSDRSPSLKMIFEHLAASLPTAK